MPTPVGPDDYKAVKRLHRQGLSRNEIARKLGRSGRTISRIAAELGLDFIRGERTRAATEAKVMDGKARRAALALQLLVDAEDLRKQAWEQCVAWNFGGKDNTFNSTVVDRPSFRDQRDIYAAVGIAIEKSVRLDAYDADPGIDGAKSMLAALAAGLGHAYEQLTTPDGD